MSMTDPIADMLVRIKNGAAVGKPSVSMPASRVKLAIAEVLKSEGYVVDARVSGEGAKKTRSEEHTSELQSLMRISYAVFCLKKKNTTEIKLNKYNNNHNM